jgi:3-phosphoglycerate kinase
MATSTAWFEFDHCNDKVVSTLNPEKQSTLDVFCFSVFCCAHRAADAVGLADLVASASGLKL